MAEFMNWPNVVYLAAFADGSVKVGTSRRERIETRLLEQGAWLSVIVAEVTDGYQVRRLEDLLSHKFDLSQSVSVRRKQAGLVNPRPSDLLSADLDRWVERVTPFVDDFGATTIARRWEHPDRRELEQRRLLAYPADPTVGPHDLGLAGSVGRIGLAQRADAADWFIFDLGVLFGLELDWGDHGSTPLVIQDSLF